MDNISQLATKYYEKYISDESIIGFDGLLREEGFGSKRRLKIRNRIYELFGKDDLIRTYRSRLAKSAHKNRTPEDYYISPEQREKMIVGIKKSWENADERKEHNRRLMVKYCHPKAWNAIANNKRVQSRKTGKGWKPHSLQTRKKLSIILRNRWLNGFFDHRRPTIKSKGQLELCSLLKEIDSNLTEEFRIDSKPFDAFLPSNNLLFEFNGTYWHLDPRVYEPLYWDKFREKYAYEIWRKDNLKNMSAMKQGYKVITIWQIDWDSCEDKRIYLRKMINESIR